jgi:hypothetical protein
MYSATDLLALELRREAQVEMLLRLLRLKFGNLDPETERQVCSAHAACILQWGDRVLTATSLEDVFLEAVAYSPEDIRYTYTFLICQGSP